MNNFTCLTDKQCKNKCQLCGEHPYNAEIQNKNNGIILKVCKNCAEYVLGKKVDKL